jgi:DNA-binding MarR family transcriptional regulator
MTGRNEDSASYLHHLPYLLHMAMVRLRAEGDPVRAGVDPSVRAAHLRLLDLIPPGGARVTALARDARITKQGLGQLVSQLAERGWVEVGRDPADRRAKVVWSTPRGDEIRRTAHGVVAAIEARWRSEVGDRRYQTFREVLDELVNGAPERA